MRQRYSRMIQNIAILICIVIFSFSFAIDAISISGFFSDENIISISVPGNVRLAPRWTASQGINYSPVALGYTSYDQGYASDGQGYISGGQGYASDGQRYASDGQGYASSGHGYTAKARTMESKKENADTNYSSYEIRPVLDSSGDISDALYVWEQGYSRYWSQKDTLNVFSEKNSDGQCLIAPGSEGVYDFAVCNGASFSVDYAMTITYENDYNIPLSFRLRKGSQYLAGDETNWVPAAQLTQVINSKTLSGGEEAYSLDWQWPFYTDNVTDQNDTDLGILAQNQPVEFLLNFELYAEQAGPETPDKPLNINSPKTGDESQFTVYVIIIILSVAVLLFLILTRRRRKEDEIKK